MAFFFFFKVLLTTVLVLPVYNVVGLFCADDTEGVDGSVRRREVSVLTRSSGEASCRRLTTGQELTHAGERPENKDLNTVNKT